MKSETKRLLAVPGYSRLLAARLISNFGNGLGPIALAFGVLDLPNATATTLSIVMTAQLFPIVAFMLLGGVVADRFPRAMVVGVSDVLLSGLVIANGISLIMQRATVTSLVVIALLSGTLNALWWPAFAGLVPEIVPEEDLQTANSFVALASNVAMILGTVSGGLLVLWFGAGQAIVIDGVTFLVAGCLVFTLRKFGTRRTSDGNSTSVVQDLVHGWREFVTHKWVVAVVAGYSVIAMLFESVLAVVGPYHAKEVLGGPKPWSLILAGLSAGTVLGVVVTVRARPKRPLIAGLIVQVGMVIWLASLGLTNSIPILVLTAFLCGFAFDFFMVLWQTALQSNIPREALSRVSSYDAFGSLLFAPLGVLISGPLIHRVGTSQLLIAFAVVTFIVLLAMLSVPSVRALEGKPPQTQGAQSPTDLSTKG